MKLDNLEALNSLLGKASGMIADLKLGENHQEGQAEIELLSLLFAIQSAVVSIRAKRCVGQFVAEDPDTVQKEPSDKVGADVIPWNRRQFRGDRRKLRTYIAEDRRTGIADRRRKKTPSAL